MLCIYQYISVLKRKWGSKLRDIVHFPFRKWNSFNNARKEWKVGIDLVDAMFNTLRTLEMTNVSQLLSSIRKHYHTQWSPNISQWFMYEVIVKYVIQSPECVKQGTSPICAKFHIFPKMINGVLFLERSKYHFIYLNFSPAYYRSSGKTTACTLYAISQHTM